MDIKLFSIGGNIYAAPNIPKMQERVFNLYQKRGYTEDVLTLTLGLCEEAGEVAKAVNINHNPNYKPSPHSKSDSVEHELCDVLVYAFGIANALGINLENAISSKLDEDGV